MIDIDISFGRRTEIQVGKLLSEGIPVMPLGDLPGDNGRGPRTNYANGRRVLPDFMAGALGFVEVKVKTTCMYFRKYDREEHGIDKNVWEDYRAVELEFMKRVVLVILEQHTGSVLAATLDDLQAFGQPRFGIWSNNGKPSINWHREAFTVIGTFEMPPGDPENMTINWNWKRLRSIVAQLKLPFEETYYAVEL